MGTQSNLSSGVPMSETAFYILLSLQEPNHGYGIMLNVESITSGRIKLGPGTLYGTLSKMEKNGLIQFISEENKRKNYVITTLGEQVLQMEIARIGELYHNSKGKVRHE